MDDVGDAPAGVREWLAKNIVASFCTIGMGFAAWVGMHMLEAQEQTKAAVTQLERKVDVMQNDLGWVKSEISTRVNRP